MCSKHVEAWNKLIIKFSASSWLILRNKYIEMHGQQNIKICDPKQAKHVSPDDEHMCSKHVEAWNKLIIKFSASSWLIFINKYSNLMLHNETIDFFFWEITGYRNSMRWHNEEFSGAIARVRKKVLLAASSASACLSVRPHGTNRLPLDGFL